MPKMPIEIVTVGTNFPSAQMRSAIASANLAQTQFTFMMADNQIISNARTWAFREFGAEETLTRLVSVKNSGIGYHPFVILFVHGDLQGTRWANLFGEHDAGRGVAVVSTANVASLILPEDRLAAFFLYYFARYTLSFLIPSLKSHPNTHGCLLDFKQNRLDILKSMRPGALCDGCRRQILEPQRTISHEQVAALASLLEKADRIRQGAHSPLPRIFIGSSTEGLRIAEKVKELLQSKGQIDIWNESNIFRLGNSTLEDLQSATRQYDFAILVFTPDDVQISSGLHTAVPRDNVVFELGLFIGALGRNRAFVVNTKRGGVKLPSDLHGITMALYDPKCTDLSEALAPACAKIEEAMNRAQDL